MTNKIKAALAATLITFAGLGAVACAPEAPETPVEVEAPTDPTVPGPCADGATPENTECQVP
jgi:hypothetical protein